ncbi:MAG: hypothetical protein P1Q69_04590 [Candidatus Thorarchaeota archaeon]|nr:hypothetical protein [Candidatus Thorarchaeota archaeon]
MADCYDQTSLAESVSSKDPAMVNAVETPFVIKRCGAFDNLIQRTEARSHLRNNVPMKRGKACYTLKNYSFSDAGDSRREKGGTQKFPLVVNH